MQAWGQPLLCSITERADEAFPSYGRDPFCSLEAMNFPAARHGGANMGARKKWSSWTLGKK